MDKPQPPQLSGIGWKYVGSFRPGEYAPLPMVAANIFVSKYISDMNSIEVQAIGVYDDNQVLYMYDVWARVN